MSIVMSLISIILALIIGFLIGRYEKGVLQEEEKEEVKGSDEGKHRRRKSNSTSLGCGTAIASPAAGRVSYYCEGGRTGVVIEPEQGFIYAPTSGKITKIFPMGNAFILQTDTQRELLILVGRKQPDELCSMYYRIRVVQNEIVSKGKLLMTFDKERLVEAGEEPKVTVSLEDALNTGLVTVTDKEVVKVGEDLMWVREDK